MISLLALSWVVLAEPPAPRCVEVPQGYGPRGTTPVRAEPVFSGLEVPWGIGFLPNGDWLMTERPGRLRLVRQGHLEPAPVATVTAGRSEEGGLLGIAVHPRFSENRAFYLYVTAEKDRRPVNQVQRWSLAGDERTAQLERVVVDDLPAARYHDGGRIRFGPDGMLYIGVGDARRPEAAQDLNSPSGKLLRLSAEGRVPSGGSFPRDAIVLSGVRNTEGFDWMPGGWIVLVDHGPSGEYRGWTGSDEVNVVRPGANLGWPLVRRCDEHLGMVSPSLTWVDAVPPGGAALYTGERIPEWKRSLLVGTLKSKHLHRVVFDQTDPTRIVGHEVYFEGDPPNGLGRLREVVIGPDGELYVTTSNCDGRGSCPPQKDQVFRIVRQ